MLAYAQDSTKTLKRDVKKRYPEFDKPRVRLEKVGAELFVIDYASDIENSLNDGNKDKVNLKKLSELRKISRKYHPYEITLTMSVNL